MYKSTPKGKSNLFELHIIKDGNNATLLANFGFSECCLKNLPKLLTFFVTDILSAPLCYASQLHCANGTCMSRLKFQNGVNDCGDNSDEGIVIVFIYLVCMYIFLMLNSLVHENCNHVCLISY